MSILREGIFQIEFAILLLCGIIMLFKKVEFKKILINLSFGLYLATVIAVCFFPIEIGYGGEGMANNFIPFKSIIQSVSESIREKTPYGIKTVIGNFIMLMPLGLFFEYYVKDYRQRFLDVLLFSVSIETIQFIIGLLIGYNYRCIDIDDVILNTLGGVISILIVHFIVERYKKKRRSDNDA